MGGKAGLIALCLLFIGCQYSQDAAATKQKANDNNKVEEKIIYGEDNRVDIYEILDPTWQMIAGSTVALVQQSNVTEKSGNYHIKGNALGPSWGLCKDERFYNQPAAAFCSGSLIGPDIVLTAGHCLRSLSSCKKTRFVFNYGYISANYDPSIVSKDDVYECANLIHSEVQGYRGSDFAIVQLDRPVVGRTPLDVRQSGDISDGEDVVVVGHPSGLPTKLADGAYVRENDHEDYFVTNLDTYGGNSGSAVLNATTLEVEGILVRGDTDYVLNGSCRVSNVCEEDQCRGEDVTRVGKIFDHISFSALDGSENNEDGKQEQN